MLTAGPSLRRQRIGRRGDDVVDMGHREPPLRDRDTIIVNRSFFGQALDVVNEVLVPISTVGSLLNNNYWWNNR